MVCIHPAAGSGRLIILSSAGRKGVSAVSEKVVYEMVVQKRNGSLQPTFVRYL